MKAREVANGMQRQALRPAESTNITGALPVLDLRPFKSHVSQLVEIEKTVGVVNPRPPGLLNNLIQSAKKQMQRGLAWYTRPLKQFHSAVIDAILAEAESRKLMEASINLQLNDLSRRSGQQLENISKLEEALERLGQQLERLEKTIDRTGGHP